MVNWHDENKTSFIEAKNLSVQLYKGEEYYYLTCICHGIDVFHGDLLLDVNMSLKDAKLRAIELIDLETRHYMPSLGKLLRSDELNE